MNIQVDDSSIEIDSDTVRVNPLGVTNLQNDGITIFVMIPHWVVQ